MGMILVGAGHEDFYRRIPPGCEALTQANIPFGKLAYPLTQLGITRLAGNVGLLEPIIGEMLNQAPSGLRAELLSQTLYQPRYWKTYVAEMTSIPESETEVRSTGNLGKLPLVVVSGNPDVGRVPASCRARDGIALSKELQIALVHLSSRGEQIVYDTCGHYIPLTDPQLVLDAVNQLLKGTDRQDGA